MKHVFNGVEWHTYSSVKNAPFYNDQMTPFLQIISPQLHLKLPFSLFYDLSIKCLPSFSVNKGTQDG